MLLGMVWGGPALARPPVPFPLTDAPNPVAGMSLEDRISDLSLEVGTRLRTVTFDLFDLRLDVRHRSAHLRFGGEFGLESDITVIDDGVRVDTRVKLRIGGKKVTVRLPHVEMLSENYRGDSFLAIRFPIIEGRF